MKNDKMLDKFEEALECTKNAFGSTIDPETEYNPETTDRKWGMFALSPTNITISNLAIPKVISICIKEKTKAKRIKARMKRELEKVVAQEYSKLKWDMNKKHGTKDEIMMQVRATDEWQKARENLDDAEIKEEYWDLRYKGCEQVGWNIKRHIDWEKFKAGER